MSATRLFSIIVMASLLAAAVLLSGCSTVPRDSAWTGSYFPHAQAMYVPPPQYPAGMHVGRMPFYVGSMGGASTQAVYGQPYQQSAQAPVFQGMLPDTARYYLAKLDAMDPKPCGARDHVTRTSVGTFIGLLLGQAIGGNTKATLAGGLIGALGGNASAQMSCDRWEYLRLQFQLVIDQQNRCTGEVRRVNGQTTSDERCTYVRGYTPEHQPPQIGR